MKSKKQGFYIQTIWQRNNVKSKIIHPKMCKGAYESINLVNSTTYLANKYHKHLKSIANELSNEDLEALGMK